MATKFRVVGHRVAIDPDLPEEQTDWGFLMDVGDSHKREMASTQEGTIIGIGPNAWVAFDNGEPWAKLGDRVVFAKHAGKFYEQEDGSYIVVINDEDVQGILEEVEDD